MNQTELYNCLSQEDQHLVIIYFASGACFLLFSYLVFYCKFLHRLVKYGIPILMTAIGVMLFSIGGKLLNGHPYELNTLSRILVVTCTLIGFWVVYSAIKWNKELRQKKEAKLKSNSNNH